jgi:hypothetical protein
MVQQQIGKNLVPCTKNATENLVLQNRPEPKSRRQYVNQLAGVAHRKQFTGRDLFGMARVYTVYID